MRPHRCAQIVMVAWHSDCVNACHFLFLVSASVCVSHRNACTVYPKMQNVACKCRPADLGIDVVCASATKYLNGHSDISAGVVAGSAEFIKRVCG